MLRFFLSLELGLLLALYMLFQESESLWLEFVELTKTTGGGGGAGGGKKPPDHVAALFLLFPRPPRGEEGFLNRDRLSEPPAVIPVGVVVVSVVVVGVVVVVWLSSFPFV